MPQAPDSEKPPAPAGQGTAEEGARQLDSLFPEAAPAAPDKKEPPEPEVEDKGEESPDFESELDALLGFEPEAEPEGDLEEEPEQSGREPEADADLIPVINEDGTEERVTREEARNRSLRRADYTRKTQELAEERRKLDAARETELSELGKLRERFVAELKQVEEAMNAPEPDWEKVRRDSPDEYLALREEWRTQQEAKRRVGERRRQEEDNLRAEFDKKMEAHVRKEQERLLAAIPELSDATKGPVLRDQMFEVGAKAYGFTQAELQAIKDHRPWLVMRDAMRFRQILAKRQELRKNAKPKDTKTLKPGTPAPKGAGKARAKEAAISRARSTGDARDAAAVLDALGM